MYTFILCSTLRVQSYIYVFIGRALRTGHPFDHVGPHPSALSTPPSPSFGLGATCYDATCAAAQKTQPFPASTCNQQTGMSSKYMSRARSHPSKAPRCGEAHLSPCRSLVAGPVPCSRQTRSPTVMVKPPRHSMNPRAPSKEQLKCCQHQEWLACSLRGLLTYMHSEEP